VKDFSINSNAKKQEIMEQYGKLLDSYKKKVKDSEEHQKRVTELERKLEAEAGQVAREATISSVINAIGELRGQVGATLNELTDQMSARAEKLEGLGRAIAVQERRLQELYDIEAAADTLNKLVATYEERRSEAETAYASMLEEMQRELKEKKNTIEAELKEQKENLETAIQDQRTKWLEEKAKEKKDREEEKARLDKDREREETEYLYERDRARKLEKNDYEERKTFQEKALKEAREQAEKTLSEREAELLKREQKVGELESEVASFPKRLDETVARVKKELTAQLAEKAENDARLKSVESEWEKKISAQKIEHLEQIIKSQENKIAEIGEELRNAQKQVNEVAKKAIEGASLNKAFQTVNEIALEQAKHPEGGKTQGRS
jgi:hypothetical protein